MDVDAVAGLRFNAEVLGCDLVHVEHRNADFLHHDVAVARCTDWTIIDHAIQNGGVTD